jgi:hypothetical protein
MRPAGVANRMLATGPRGRDGALGQRRVPKPRSAGECAIRACFLLVTSLCTSKNNFAGSEIGRALARPAGGRARDGAAQKSPARVAETAIRVFESRAGRANHFKVPVAARGATKFVAPVWRREHTLSVFAKTPPHPAYAGMTTERLREDDSGIVRRVTAKTA